MLTFDWDDEKAERNLAKHGVDFPSACRVFEDLGATGFEDRTMNYGEVRWTIIGLVRGILLTVAYVERADIIRIISARKATRHEERLYAEERGQN